MSREYEIAFKLGADLESSFSKTFTNASSDFKQLHQQVQGLQKDRGTSNLTKPVREDLKRTQSEMRNTETSTNNMVGMLKKAGTAVAGFFAVRKVISLGRDFVQTYADFEQGMANVRAVAGLDKTSAEFQKLNAKAREMGERTSKTASEAADGLQYLALAGWDTEQMLAGIEPVLRLSEAGAIDLGRASDLATDSMAALGIEVHGLNGYLDQVVQTSRKSNTSIEQLLESFLVVGGSFKTFNVPLEESNALLGILANRGYKGTQAGTGLNAVLTNLTSGAGKAGKAMEELNLSAFDSEGNFKGFEATLFEVKEKIDSMTDAQKAQYITALAGKEHMKTFNALLAGMGAEYHDLKRDIMAADGALMEMAETQMDTFTGSMKLLESAIESAKITIGEKLAPTIRNVAEWISERLPEAVDKFEKNLPRMIKTAQTTAKAVGAVGAAILAIRVGKGAADTVSFIKNIGTASVGINTTARATSMLGFGIGALTNPVGLATTAIAGLTMGVIAYRRNQEKMRQDIIRMGVQLGESSKRYDDITNKSKQTQDLVEEYRQLNRAIENNVGSAEELAKKKERLAEVTALLQALHPDIITQYEVENGLREEKLDLVLREVKAETELEKLRLRKEVRERSAELPQLTKEISRLEEQLKATQAQSDAFDEARAAFKEFRLEWEKIDALEDPEEQRTKIIDLRDRINAVGKNVGIQFNASVDGDLLDKQIDYLDKEGRKSLGILIETREELDEAIKSYETLYESRKALLELEMDLGESIDSLIKRYDELSTEGQNQVNQYILSIRELNREMGRMPDEKRINIGQVYKETGQSLGGFSGYDVFRNVKESVTGFKNRVLATPFTEGGIVRRPTLSMVGEGGDTEVVVPINNRPRSHALLEAANSMMGRSRGGGDIHLAYAPTIHADGASPGVLKQVEDQIQSTKDDLIRQLKELLRQEKRLAFDG